MGYIVNPSGGGVASVTGWNVDNSDPVNPVVGGKQIKRINETAYFNPTQLNWFRANAVNNDVTCFDVINTINDQYSLRYSHLFNFIQLAASKTGIGYMTLDLRGGFGRLYSQSSAGSEFSFWFNNKVIFKMSLSGGVRSLGFFENDAAQQGPIANPSGGAVVDIEARAAIDAILTAFENYGLLKL
jgi:hypothetical protein